MSPSALFRSARAEPTSAAAIALAAGWLLVIGFRVGGPTVAVYVSDIGTAVAALGAAAVCLAAARRSDGALRWTWITVGLSALCWGSGQVIWTWYELVLQRPVPFPSLADAGYLAAIPFAVAGMVTFPFGRWSAVGRVRALADGVVIALSALMTSWVFVLKTVYESSGSPFARAISLAYPIGDVIVVTIVLSVLLLRQAKRGALLLPALIGTAFVAMAFSDSAFVYQTGQGTYTTGTLVDAGWLVGYALLIVAAGRRDRVVAESASRRTGGMILPYVAVAAALLTTSLAQARVEARDPFLAWLRTALIIALVLRQVFILFENSSLTKMLERQLRELRVREQRFEALVLHSSDVVTVVDAEGVVGYQSESIQRVFGHPSEGTVGRRIAEIMTAQSASHLEHALDSVRATSGATRVLGVQIVDADGGLRHAEMTMTNLLHDPAVRGVVLNTRDVSEQRLLEQRLVHEASHDPLTALANRALFRDRVDRELHRPETPQPTLTVLFLDLDGFKEVNDSLGHASGDRLLVEVADRLRACVRPEDTVARLGGDEFAVLIADESSEGAGVAVAERITNALRDPFRLGGRDIEVGASIGISATDQDVEDADHLLRNADLAMYRAKATGPGKFERYHPRLHIALVERLQLEAELRQALATGELELHYQPVVTLSSCDIVGIEALARWNHARRGFVSPGEFIPLAEQTGLIRRLGQFGLNEACRQLAEWTRAFPAAADLTVSVNISGRHFQEASLFDDVQDALAIAELDPARLVLELTESMLMDDTDANVELLGRLKSLGVKIAVDDFGTGYSSLAYLHRFPADVIKIDRSFVERFAGSNLDAAFLQTIVQLGKNLRMVTVAEGIETAEQALALQQMGCELAQGFHFFRPLAPERVQQLFADAKPGRAAA